MKPFVTLAQTRTPDGSQFSLVEHDGEFYLKLNGRQLMSTIATVSEVALADLPCRKFGVTPGIRVLIGGLGLGFSLRRALELVGKDAEVHVAELLPEVVQWNREFLQGVNGKLLADKRTKIIEKDVYNVIGQSQRMYDAILLDVDNGPKSFVQAGNSRIYKRRGLAMIAAALKPGGKVAFWSASEEPGFTDYLASAGFRATAVPVKSHPTAKRFAHVIYVAEHGGPPPLVEKKPAREVRWRR